MSVEIVDHEGMGMSALRRTGEMRVIVRQIVMAVDEVDALFRRPDLRRDHDGG